MIHQDMVTTAGYIEAKARLYSLLPFAIGKCHTSSLIASRKLESGARRKSGWESLKEAQSIVPDERSNGYWHSTDIYICICIYREGPTCSMNYLASAKWPSVYLPSNRGLRSIRGARLISPPGISFPLPVSNIYN